MLEVNPQNERLKLDWIEELEVSKAGSTIDQRLAALGQYEAATDWADFNDIDRDRVKTYLDALRSTPTRMRTKQAKVRHVRGFFDWMIADERLRPKKVRKALLSLRLTDKEERAGRAVKTVDHATVAQIQDTIQAMPKISAVDRRNRALLAFTLLSGARDGAIVTMKLKHVRWAEREVLQHPDEVATKASKLIQTWFFPVGKAFEDEVESYLTYLKEKLSFTPNDPLFPSTRIGQDDQDRFAPIGLTKTHWASAAPMRKIFKDAFTANGMRYYNPHSFRNTVTALGYELDLGPKHMKAWSQNLGHSKLDTTYNSYGNLDANAQRRAMMAIGKPAKPIDTRATLAAMIDQAVARHLEGGGG